MNTSNNTFIGKKPPDSDQDGIDINPLDFSTKYHTFSDSEQTPAYEELSDSYYSEGKISPVEEEGLTIVACDQINKNINKISSSENLILLTPSQDETDFIKINEDVRYSPSISGARNIFIDKIYPNLNDYKIIIDNFIKNSNYKADLYIKSVKDIVHHIDNYSSNRNLKLSVLKKDNKEIMKISKDFSDKICLVNFPKKANFICDIANTYKDKAKGLQGIDVLKENQGMVFPYKYSSDVSFHMGTVKFPIDILFIDEDNKIKKISKNILPNTLGTYSCANIKNVLEINGGYSDKFNISEGDYVSITLFGDLNNDEINKITKNININNLSKRASFGTPRDEHIDSVLAIDFNDIIDVNSISVKVFNKNSNFNINGDSFLKLGSEKICENRFYNKVIKQNVDKINNFIKELDNDFTNKIIVYDNNGFDKNSALLVISDALRKLSYEEHNIDLIKIPRNFSINNIDNAIKNRFGANKVFFMTNKIIKTAGFSIPEDTKNTANKVDQKLIKALDRVRKIIKDLDKNLSAYEKIKDNAEIIKSSKGQYRQSVNRISKKYKKLLELLKDSIGLMDDIKDVSKVLEIISAVILSSKNCSKKIKDVFDMVDKTHELEFFDNFSKKTEDSKKIFEDLKTNIQRMREFIYANILGKTIISE